MSIVKHYEECLEKYGDSHKGVDWPNEEDAQVRYSVMLDVIKNKNEKASLLDFGCGMAHLYEYIVRNNLAFIDYSGLDISDKYYNMCLQKFPKVKFYLSDILENSHQLPSFDYVILNGVFTEKVALSFEEMFDYFQQIIKVAYKKSYTGMAFNVMSSNVEWEREDLFYLPLDTLSGFLTKEVTRSFVIRSDYGLYEYTVYLYK